MDVGGMAIVEGVLLRSPRRWCAATRLPDGTIATRTGEVPGWSVRWAATPGARGIVALAEALTLGVRAVLWSGDLHAPPGRGGGGDVTRLRLAAALVPGLAVTVSLVFLLPTATARLLAGGGSGTVEAAVEAVARLVIVVGYLAGVGRLTMIRRVFGYHGAEHKIVALHEAGLEPSLDAARAQPMRHRRCGTTFLAVVVAVTSVAHLAQAPLHGLPLPALLGLRLALVPVVAAVAYEVLTAANRRPGGRLAGFVLPPGLALQALTVHEPDDAQLEVALVALQGAVAVVPVPAPAEAAPVPACQPAIA